MKAKQELIQAVSELKETLQNIDESQLKAFIETLNLHPRIFVYGAGRSLLMMKAFAMRLMHVGFEAYVVGEVTTPAFRKGDLLVMASASGETKSLLMIAEKAKAYQGQLLVLTIFEGSSLGKLADGILRIPAYTDKLAPSETNRPSLLTGSSLFEEAVLLVGDTIIFELAKQRQLDLTKAFDKHANLE
jgi:6-phospho-3-hexuloisomerase